MLSKYGIEEKVENKVKGTHKKWKEKRFFFFFSFTFVVRFFVGICYV